MNEWMEWMDGWIDRWMQRRPDHSVKYRQSLDYGSTGTAPQATNVCQCSQLQDQWVYGAEKPEDQHDTCFSFFSPCCAIVQSLHPSPPQLHRQSCQWGSSYPQRGVSLQDLKAPNLQMKTFGHLGLISFLFSFYFVATWAFELEMHLIKAEELPGGTVLQQRTVQIREELRKCTFLERIK